MTPVTRNTKRILEISPEISLIIPTYNSEDFIAQTLESVRAQTLPPDQFEVIILDDKSTDNTASIAQVFANKYENVHMYFHDNNQRISKTRNDAIEKSKGKLIATLDGDDILEPIALQSTLAFMKNNQRVRYSYSGYNRINTRGNKIGQVASLPFDKKRLFHQNFVGHIKCFERELHDRIRGFENGSRIEDWDHVLKASEVLSPGQIARNPEFLYNHRIHENNTSKVDYQRIRKVASNTVGRFLKKQGINAKVYWSKMIANPDGSKHNYYDWKLIPISIFR